MQRYRSQSIDTSTQLDDEVEPLRHAPMQRRYGEYFSRKHTYNPLKTLAKKKSKSRKSKDEERAFKPSKHNGQSQAKSTSRKRSKSRQISAANKPKKARQHKPRQSTQSVHFEEGNAEELQRILGSFAHDDDSPYSSPQTAIVKRTSSTRSREPPMGGVCGDLDDSASAYACGELIDFLQKYIEFHVSRCDECNCSRHYHQHRSLREAADPQLQMVTNLLQKYERRRTLSDVVSSVLPEDDSAGNGTRVTDRPNGRTEPPAFHESKCKTKKKRKNRSKKSGSGSESSSRSRGRYHGF